MPEETIKIPEELLVDVHELFLPMQECTNKLRSLMKEYKFIALQHQAAHARFWKYMEDKIPECDDDGQWKYEPDENVIKKIERNPFASLNLGGMFD